MRLLLKTAFVLCLLGSQVFAGGDAGAGEKAYKKCKSCHSIVDNDGNVILKGGKTGPNLYGLAGRIAASVDGFKYGKSLKALGETGFAWSEADFISYVADPTKFLRASLDDSKAKSKMSYKLKKEKDAQDIWVYLTSVSE